VFIRCSVNWKRCVTIFYFLSHQGSSWSVWSQRRKGAYPAYMIKAVYFWLTHDSNIMLWELYISSSSILLTISSSVRWMSTLDLFLYYVPSPGPQCPWRARGQRAVWLPRQKGESSSVHSSQANPVTVSSSLNHVSSTWNITRSLCSPVCVAAYPIYSRFVPLKPPYTFSRLLSSLFLQGEKGPFGIKGAPGAFVSNFSKPFNWVYHFI